MKVQENILITKMDTDLILHPTVPVIYPFSIFLPVPFTFYVIDFTNILKTKPTGELNRLRELFETASTISLTNSLTSSSSHPLAKTTKNGLRKVLSDTEFKRYYRTRENTLSLSDQETNSVIDVTDRETGFDCSKTPQSWILV